MQLSVPSDPSGNAPIDIRVGALRADTSVVFWTSTTQLTRPSRSVGLTLRMAMNHFGPIVRSMVPLVRTPLTSISSGDSNQNGRARSISVNVPRSITIRLHFLSFAVVVSNVVHHVYGRLWFSGDVVRVK